MQHTIAASQVQLALLARRLKMASRWAAMSAHVETQSCDRHPGTYRSATPSLAGPMQRGKLYRVIHRVQAQGRREVLATFGTGIRAMQIEAGTHSLRA